MSTPHKDTPLRRDSKPTKPLIVLIHGIRTQARWQKRIAPLLAENSQAVIWPIGYGFQNVFEFLLPGPTRQHAIKEILWRLDKAVEEHPGFPLVIVAHSFGTYCIAQILKEHPRIKPVRLLMCGSVVDRNFRWDQLKQQPVILNECGTRDIWPLLARSSTWGYGESGTFGFKTPGVIDRFHDCYHGDYFRETFVRRFWTGYVLRGEIVASDYEREMTEAPWWSSLISLRWLWLPWLGWLCIAAIASAAAIALKSPRSSAVAYHEPQASAGKQAKILAITQEAQQAEKYAEDRFQAIATTLRNPTSSLPDQVLALQELPDALCIRVPVTVVDDRSSFDVRVEFNLPNLIRLRDVLRQYIRADRIKSLQTPNGSSDDVNTLEPLTECSTEIFHTLYRLGPPDSSDSRRNLWSWLPDGYQSGLPRAKDENSIPKPRVKLEKNDKAVLDLSHIGVRDLERLCAPWAMFNAPEWSVRFPEGAILEGVQLQGSLLEKAELKEADFRDSSLQRITLSFAALRRARFFNTSLQGAEMSETDLRGSHFDESHLEGARLINAKLVGAGFGSCAMEGADLGGANMSWSRVHGNLAGANLSSASLYAASLRAECTGATLSEVTVAGALFAGSNFGSRHLACSVDTPKERPPRTFVTPPLLVSIFHIESPHESESKSPIVIFPGAIMTKWLGLSDTVEFVHLIGISGDECMAKLRPVLDAEKPNDRIEAARDLLNQIPFLADHEVEEAAWSPDVEPALLKAFGRNHVKRDIRSVTLLQVGMGTTEFVSEDGGAWMDKETLDGLRKLLSDESDISMADSIRDMRDELDRVEPRGNYFGAWLQDRYVWNFFDQFEKAKTALAKPAQILPVQKEEPVRPPSAAANAPMPSPPIPLKELIRATSAAATDLHNWIENDRRAFRNNVQQPRQLVKLYFVQLKDFKEKPDPTVTARVFTTGPRIGALTGTLPYTYDYLSKLGNLEQQLDQLTLSESLNSGEKAILISQLSQIQKLKKNALIVASVITDPNPNSLRDKDGPFNESYVSDENTALTENRDLLNELAGKY